MIVSGKLYHIDCKNLMKTARNGRRKLGNNTYLYEGEGGSYDIVLHETVIINIAEVPDPEFGTTTHYTLNTGGWQTPTTKARINLLSPANIWQEKHIWYIEDGLPYRDGVVIDVSGKIVSGAGTAEDVDWDKKFYKVIGDYAQGYARHIAQKGLPAPSGGDCWGCFFPLGATEKLEKGGEVMGHSHYISHFGIGYDGQNEPYYVPSLLARALSEYYGEENSKDWFATIHHDPSYWQDVVKRVLRGFFKRRKDAILDEYRSFMLEGDDEGQGHLHCMSGLPLQK